jgi:FAD/FMN-containing dehydrogenase
MWALRHALSEGVKSAGRLVAFDLAFRRGDVMRFRSHMRTELARQFSEAEICDFGHVGDGGVHFNLVVPAAGATGELIDRLREIVITTAVEEFGGSFSAEHGLGRRNQLFYDRYENPRSKRLAAAFKRATSPAPIGAVILG